RELGVRVVAPDRPGVAGSARQPGRRLLDWPADAAALADALGIERFAVAGWSAGGAYAAACGHALGDRVTAVALVAAAIPGDWPGARTDGDRMDRLLMALATGARPVARGAFGAARLAVRVAPGAWRRGGRRWLGPTSGAVAAGLAADVAGAVAQPAGAVDDYRVLAEPWGFDPAAIAAPVAIWQGDADRLVPAAWAGRLAEAIPGATVHLRPGEGHALGPAAWREILAWAAATTTETSPDPPPAVSG
ncbi:MAG: alpha/beta fold hydrolase, partial [Solirubrobacterales bacterium]|nr:alpha/beta fold hydrolase [Solirubrobacterales bacterium]